MGDHLHHATEGVAVFVGFVYFRNHEFGGGAVRASHRVLVNTGAVSRSRWSDKPIDRHRPNSDGVAEHVNSQLLEEGLSDGAESHSRGCFAGRGTFQDRSGFVETVLLHPCKVGVSRSWPGESGTPSAFKLGGIHRPRTHYLFPFGPFGVSNSEGDRPSLSEAVADTTGDTQLISLKLHSGSSAIAKAPACECRLDLFLRERHSGGQTFQNGNEFRAV